ncbi:hypothetical protein Tco_0895783 [Tanacetum coccineum]|uniref:GAG-pre-integrase domain-containing protein n=1 Tax=Tanacetum coccineum TaxID=301880 RepID=A0ABQ5CJ05_9ASTR
MVKNLENVSGKFLMYPRFVQVFLDKQLEGMEIHDEIYIAPSHTKKIFRNMRRVGKGFSGSETPLFPTMVVQAQEDMGEDLANPTDLYHTPTIILPSTSQPQKKQKHRRLKRKETEVPRPSGPTTNVADEAVNKEMDDNLERAATTATSLDAERDKGNINKTQSKATPNEPSSPGTSSSGGPRIESSKDEGLGEEDASKQGRIDDIDANEDIYMVNVHRDKDMFGVNDLEGDEVVVETEVDHEVVVETEVASKDVNLSADEVTLAQALAALKSIKPKADKVMIQEPEKGTITTTTAATTITTASTRPKAKGLVIHEEEQATTPIVSSQQPSQVKVQDKGKEIMVEEPLKMKKKDQVNFDKQEAKRLQAEFDEEERLAREKDEANVALTKEWNDIQAKNDGDYQLAQRLQAQEQEELTDAKKARLFVQLLEQRRKHFAAKRAKEKRNRPPTRAQQRSIMCTYLKNMEGWKPKSLKSKSFANIRELFDKAFKRVNTFVDYKTEVMEESSKKAEAEIAQESSSKRERESLEQESSKKQKVEDLEVLWSIVKARFKKTEPVNYMDNFLHLNLKTMFEHHIEDIGRIVRIKSLLEVTTAQVRVTAAKQNLVLLNTMKFGNDQIAPILGYGDLAQGNIIIKWVYYVEGLNHNLFSVGQFCDADLEVAFQKSTCYIRDLNENDTDHYSITFQDSSTPNLIFLMAKASSLQAWLWHRLLSHLNFDTINLLSKYDIVTDLPKLKFVKDQLFFLMS